MRLADILTLDLVKVPLAAEEKTAAINEMVELLVKAGVVKSQEIVLSSVLEREATRTTGVGHGLAIPHSKCAGVDRLVMAVGKPPVPIDFQSIDGRPVFIICLLVSPPDQTAAHIQALAKISRLMTNDVFRGTLKSAKTAEEVFNALIAQDKILAGPGA